MNIHTNQSGFSVVELVIVLAVVAVLGFVGYSIHNLQNNKTADTSTTQTASGQPAKANDVPSAPVINSTSDLNTASTMLDQTDPGSSNNTDASQMGVQAANF